MNSLQNEQTNENKLISYSSQIPLISDISQIDNSLQLSPLLQLPDYLIEAYIFPYLTWKELFFIVRRAHSELQEMVKSTWCNIIKEEMCNQLKNLTFLFEKDALTKAYEFKLQYLLNYRNLLLVYNLNSNIINVLQICANYLPDENIFKLLSTFFGMLGQEQCCNILYNEELPNNIKQTKIIDLLKTEQLSEDYVHKMDIILDINSIESDSEVFKELNEDFMSINRQQVEALDDNCRLIYSFLQGIIEYQNLKKNVQELKQRLEQLYIKIQKETALWPKRKKFFETAYKILLYSKSTSYKFRIINGLFVSHSIKSPLCEYKEEIYNSMIELRNIMEHKKEEIKYRLSNTNENNIDDTNNNIMNEVNDIILKNLLDRRLLLTKKILLTEKFYDIYSLFNKHEDIDSSEFKGEIISNEDILKTFMIVAHKSPDEINEDTFIQTYRLKSEIEKNNELYQNVQNSIKYNENIENNKKKEIEKLKKQKEHLVNQKKKTEQMLNVLKKYMQLKENFLQNKKKYKSILFVLSKIRKENHISENGSQSNGPNLDRIEELLESGNVEELNFNEEEISKEEKEELKNFEISEDLLKDIEKSLLQKINNFFQKEKEEMNKEEDNDNDEYNNNESNIITNNKINSNKAFSNFEIENGENVEIFSNLINNGNEKEDKEDEK